MGSQFFVTENSIDKKEAIMKKVIMIAIMVLMFCGLGAAKEYRFLSVGVNNYDKYGGEEKKEPESMGIHGSLVLPLGISDKLYYKAGVHWHKNSSNEKISPNSSLGSYYSDFDNYVASNNEIAVGNVLYSRNNFYWHAMVGMGMMVINSFNEESNGQAEGGMFLDVSNHFMITTDKLDVGLMFSYQKMSDVFFYGIDGDQYQIGIVIGKGRE